MGRKSKRGDVSVHIADPLCCAVETNTTLQSNYTPIKRKQNSSYNYCYYSNTTLGGSDGKGSACNAGDTGDADSIPGSGRSPGEGNGNPLQYSYLEKPIDRGTWWATDHRSQRIWHD